MSLRYLIGHAPLKINEIFTQWVKLNSTDSK